MGESTRVKYLIVGGGTAAAQASVGIRELDSEGSVTIVAAEKWWPYDRPPLSKAVLHDKMTIEDAESKDPSWYEKNNVEVRRGTKANSADLPGQTVSLSDGSQIGYERLLVATGSVPRPLAVAGADLVGVHLFRTAEDSLAVKEALATAKSPVFIGSGYIGLEVASAFMDRGSSVTIVDTASLPWTRTSGPVTGGFLKSYFESKGAKFHLGAEVASIEGSSKVEAVLLKEGTRIPADLVVIGVGISQNLEFAKAAGLAIDDKHGVIVDPYFAASRENVFAAGDIAAFSDPATGRKWHAEHHLNAKWQGKQAGRNMAGAGEKYEQVSYFFSDMLDIHMILRGDPLAGKPVAILGDSGAGEFTEIHGLEDGTLSAGLSISHDEPSLDKISDKLEELIKARALAADVTLESLKG